MQRLRRKSVAEAGANVIRFCRSRALISHGIFFSPASRRSLYAGARLRPGRCWDCTKENARHPRASDSNRAAEDDAASFHTSLDSDRLSQRIGGRAAQSIFAAIFQDELNRCAKIFPALFQGSSLAVRARNLRRPRHVPISVALDHGNEFIAHGTSIERKRPLARVKMVHTSLCQA